ncbi:MAG TPA: fused MFS/spermidine synthase, partial [Gemmataceae bacterium]|nr:fused MFS/spermidine synthase [Gemmataceae bacterium]
MRRSGLYVLFFLSGASALVYELVWQRLLNLVFGVTTLSVSAVLAAFMGGLALGSLLLGRYADRTARPLRWYAWLEAGIGLTGLLVPAGFAGLTLGYAGVYAHFPPGPWAGACIRFGLSVLVLVVPATLMGATLPVMGRLALRRAGSLPATFSLLYAVNTMGAVVGTALTGFVLLRVLGMRHTLWLAAGLNLAVAVSAGLADFWRRLPAACPTDEPPVANRELTTARPWLVLACAGVTGAAGMAFEVAWARILAVLTSNSAYAFALLLTVLLLGLGLGSLAQWAWSRRAGDSWRRLAQCQWLLAASTVAALPLLRTTPVWLEQWCGSGSVTKVFAGELALTAALLLLPAVLMGMSLPLLVAGLTQDAGRFGRWVGRLYAVNTLGGVAGAVAAGLLLIPWLGIQFTLGATASLVLFVGLLAWARAARPAPAWRCLAGAAVLAAASGAWLLLPAGRYLKSSPAGPRRLVFYQEGTCATVSVVEEPDGTRSLLVDGQPVAGTVSTSVIDQKMLAHIPLLLHPNPRRALTVGFGSGGTSHSMTLHGIDVDCVEIEAAVPAAGECFRSQNAGVLAHPHFRLIVDDARSWLRVAPVRYDVIVTDCTNIQYRSNGDLYTVDYFRLMRKRLAPGGLAAAWVP